MFAELEKRSVTYRESDTRIKKAKLGNKAGLYGAAYLPMLAKKTG
jgi:glucokinase